ncbi:MAG: hypothetical protein KAI57_00980 [Candidatus Pacebacteria bacterium]|nr:hypothetical protein [Candidatus Paceibacterota bacterium]
MLLLKEEGKLDETEKRKVMQVGDYIVMSGHIFKGWTSSIPVSDEDSKKIEELDTIKVVINEIISENRLLVEGEGVQKEVYSLRSEEIKKEIVFDDEIGGFDNGDSDRSDSETRGVSP